MRENNRAIAVWSLRGATARHIAGRGLFCSLILSVLILSGICLWNAVRWMEKPFPGFLLNQRMVVGYVGLRHWTGTEAGLKYPEKILNANGRSISSRKDLEEVLSAAGIGEPIRYSVDRNGERLAVEVPTMRFTVSDLLLTFGIFFFLGFLYLFTGTTVFVLKPDTTVSWLFFSGCLLESISSFISFDMESTHFGFFRLMILCDAFLPAVVLHLSFLFPEKSKLAESRPYLLVIPYVLAAGLAIALELSYPEPLFFSLYGFVLLFLILGASSLIVATLRAYFRKTSTLARQRAKVVLFGAVLAFPIPTMAPLASFLGMTLGGTKILTNLAAIPMVIFPVSIAYAIAKHNLFDVDVFIKRAVGYGIMTAVVGSAYFGIQVLIESAFVGGVFGEYAGKVSPVIFALIVVFLFNPLNRKVQGGVDRIFFRKKFDYKDTVISVSDALSSVLNLEEIVRKIIHTVRKEMFIDMSGIIVLEPKKQVSQAVFVADGTVSGKDEVKEICIPNDDALLSLVSRERKLITKYDIAEDPRYLPERESCARRFSELGAAMAVPLIHQDEVKAVLAVGHKKSGHFYSREDVELLTTLATHGAVAIENAKLAEQMQKEEIVRTNLSRYLSPQIVDKIVKHDVQVNLGGDRKVVTVLFSDIRNFTTITENRPPDQLVHILNEYFTEMAKIIFNHQGSLDKYIGDAIVAVFGSLISLENPAENAVAAAVAMMRRLPGLNRHWEARYGFSMNIGIGINTGEVFLGNIGSPERMEFTVIGDAVNVASRFSGLARPGQILMTKDTLACLGPGGNTKELPPAEVKGKSVKMEVFEVVYAHPVS